MKKGQHNDDDESAGKHDNRSQRTSHSGPGHFERQRAGATTRCTCNAKRHGTAGNVALWATQTSPHAPLDLRSLATRLGSLATAPRTQPEEIGSNGRLTSGKSLADPCAPWRLSQESGRQAHRGQACNVSAEPFTSRPRQNPQDHRREKPAHHPRTCRARTASSGSERPSQDRPWPLSASHRRGA